MAIAPNLICGAILVSDDRRAVELLCLAASFRCMLVREAMNDEIHSPGTIGQQKYRWPWAVLALFLLGIVLAFLWMSREVARTKRIRDFNSPTNRIPTSSLPFPAPSWRI
jgi:hypothetical protein